MENKARHERIFKRTAKVAMASLTIGVLFTVTALLTSEKIIPVISDKAFSDTMFVGAMIFWGMALGMVMASGLTRQEIEAEFEEAAVDAS